MNELFNGWMASAPALTVSEAYNIDNKIDDGLPQSGAVIALYVGYPPSCCGDTSTPWAAGGGNRGAGTVAGVGVSVVTTVATPGSTTTCFDNGNIVGVQKYSVSQNNGAGINCALSVQFQ
jgi:hypothetical protein